MKFIKRNKNILITVLIILIVLAITGISLYVFLFSGYKNSKYGNRLDGIENVPISEKTIEEVNGIFKEVEGVTNSKYDLSGKICYFIVTVEKGTDPTKVEKVAPTILDKFSDEQKKFYDFQILIDDGQEESDKYPVIGSKSVNDEEFNWVGKVVSDEK